MKCIFCGKPIKPKALEGTDYIKDNDGNWWCMESARLALSRWKLFEKCERLAEEPAKYRTALIDTLKWAINEGYCVKPRERCEASAEKCLRCWLKFLVKEEMEG